jgi:hypothetical protein
VKECAVNNHSSWVMSQASHSSKVQGNSSVPGIVPSMRGRGGGGLYAAAGQQAD